MKNNITKTDKIKKEAREDIMQKIYLLSLGQTDKDEIDRCIDRVLDKALVQQREDIVEMIKEIPLIEITHKDGSKSGAILIHSVKQFITNLTKEQ